MVYTVVGLNTKSKKKTLLLEASSKKEAAKIAKKQGVFPYKIDLEESVEPLEENNAIELDVYDNVNTQFTGAILGRVFCNTKSKHQTANEEYSFHLERWFFLKSFENTIICYLLLSLLSYSHIYFWGFGKIWWFFLFCSIPLAFIDILLTFFFSPKITFHKEGVLISNLLFANQFYTYEGLSIERLKTISGYTIGVQFFHNNELVAKYMYLSFLSCKVINIEFQQLKKFIGEMKSKGETSLLPVLLVCEFNRIIKKNLLKIIPIVLLWCSLLIYLKLR